MKASSRAAPARRAGRRPPVRATQAGDLQAGKVIDTFLRTLARLDPLADPAAPAAAGGNAPPRSSPRGGDS